MLFNTDSAFVKSAISSVDCESALLLWTSDKIPNLNSLSVYDGLKPSIGILLTKSPSELNIPIADAEYGATLEFINDED